MTHGISCPTLRIFFAEEFFLDHDNSELCNRVVNPSSSEQNAPKSEIFSTLTMY